VGSLEPRFFANLCRVMGREDFIPFQNNPAMHGEIRAHFAAQFRTKTRDEWFALLRETDVCVAPVYRLDEALADAHHRHRDMVVRVAHPQFGAIPMVGVGPKLSETPGSVRTLPPRPGEHTEAVLTALGYRPDRIASLRERGIVA
jgi:alpha-methylacyl-CoA racemase